MSEVRQPSNLVAMLLCVVPGLGQVYLDHILLGAVFFAGWITSTNGLFLAHNLQSANTDLIHQVALVSLILVYIGSTWHAYALSYGTDRGLLARDRRSLLRDALVAYLRDDLDDAAQRLEQAIDLDVDWQDPDPLFHLGVVMLRLAERRAGSADLDGARAARRRSQWAFRTCLSRDTFKKWRAEIKRETKRMRKLLDETSRFKRSTISERLLDADTVTASFPELRESASIPISRLNEDAPPLEGMPRTRLTPRPFNRKRLEQRLAEADALNDADTVSREKPDLEADTVELERPPELEPPPRRAWPATRRSDRFNRRKIAEAAEEAREEEAREEERREGERREEERPTRAWPATRQAERPIRRRRKTEELLEGETRADPARVEEAAARAEQAARAGDDNATRRAARPPQDGPARGELPATQPAPRAPEAARAPAELPDTRPSRRDLELDDDHVAPPEEGMPATRLGVRPQDLIPDVIAELRGAEGDADGDADGDEAHDEAHDDADDDAAPAPERRPPTTRLSVDKERLAAEVAADEAAADEAAAAEPAAESGDEQAAAETAQGPADAEEAGAHAPARAEAEGASQVAEEAREAEGAGSSSGLPLEGDEAEGGELDSAPQEVRRRRAEDGAA